MILFSSEHKKRQIRLREITKQIAAIAKERDEINKKFMEKTIVLCHERDRLNIESTIEIRKALNGKYDSLN